GRWAGDGERFRRVHGRESRPWAAPVKRPCADCSEGWTTDCPERQSRNQTTKLEPLCTYLPSANQPEPTNVLAFVCSGEQSSLAPSRMSRLTCLMKTIITTAIVLASALLAGGAELKPLNSKVMLRGYCMAGSSREDDKALGGYGKSNNLPKELTDNHLATDGKISLVVLLTNTVPFANSHSAMHRGFRLLLVNRTKSEASFEASDSRIAIVQEALDSRGKWRPIEYLPASWCGNSYHRVFLPTGHYWDFAAPQYVGTLRTQLRFVL